MNAKKTQGTEEKATKSMTNTELIQAQTPKVYGNTREEARVGEIAIIKTILEAPRKDPVDFISEQEISVALGRNRRTVANHMKKFNVFYCSEKKMKKDPIDYSVGECVDKLLPDPTDIHKNNRWSIRRIENLRCICKKYPEIELNQNDRARDIVAKYFVSERYPHEKARFKEQLRVSKSFFDMCVINDQKTLFQTAREIYQRSEGLEQYRRVKKNLNRLATEYKKHFPCYVDVSNEKIFVDLRQLPADVFQEIFHETIDEIGYGDILEALTYDSFGCVINLDYVFESCVLKDADSNKIDQIDDDAKKILDEQKEALVRLMDEIESDPASAVEKMIQENRLSGPEVHIATKMLMQKWCESQQQILALRRVVPFLEA